MPTKTPILDDYLTPDEAAAELRKNPRTLKRWRDLGDGPPFVHVGRNLYYRRSSIEAWLASREQRAA